MITTTELIKLLQDNEKGGISHRPRQISLTVNGRYLPDPQITLSSTGDGICGPEIDFDVDGEWLDGTDDVLDKIKAEIEAEPYISKMEVLEIIDKWQKDMDAKLCPRCGAKMEGIE